MLRQSIGAALSQDYPNLQVIVSDNASSDNTEQVVRSFNDRRIKYVKNKENIGASGNFAQLVDLAEGEYFSWLQDDDLIFCNFVSRAIELLRVTNAALYLGVAIKSPTTRALAVTELYCPPVPMNWLERKPAVIDRSTFAALSLFVSVSIPPVAAFRTENLRSQVASLRNCDFPLFGERTVLLESIDENGAVCDPTVCGLYLLHNDQAWRHMIGQVGRFATEWERMAVYIDSVIGTDIDYGPNLMDTLEQVPLETIQKWYEESRQWPRHVNICNQVRPFIETVVRRRLPELFQYKNGASMRLIKKFADELCPPALVRWISRNFGRGTNPRV